MTTTSLRRRIFSIQRLQFYCRWFVAAFIFIYWRYKLLALLIFFDYWHIIVSRKCLRKLPLYAFHQYPSDWLAILRPLRLLGSYIEFSLHISKLVALYSNLPKKLTSTPSSDHFSRSSNCISAYFYRTSHVLVTTWAIVNIAEMISTCHRYVIRK